MKFKVFLALLTLCLLGGYMASPQSPDAVKTDTTVANSDSLKAAADVAAFEGTDDISPGLMFFTAIAMAFVLVCIGAGIAFTVLILSIIFALVSFSVLSTSVIVGLNKRSLTKGFKTFIVLSSTVGGLLFFGGGSWMVNEFFHWWPAYIAVITGSLLGFTGGLGFGFLAFYTLQRLTTFFREKLRLTAQ